MIRLVQTPMPSPGHPNTVAVGILNQDDGSIKHLTPANYTLLLNMLSKIGPTFMTTTPIDRSDWDNNVV